MLKFLSSIVLFGFILHAQTQMYDAQSPVIQLNSENFDEMVLSDGGLWLVEFYADWCGHCKALAPEYLKVADKFKGLFKIGAVNADEDKELAGKYQIQGYPTLKVFGRDKKNPVDLNAARNSNAIMEALIKYVKDAAIPPKKSSGGSGSKPQKDGDQYLLTTDNMDSFLKSADKPVLVKFYAPWCGHCKSMAEDFKSAASDLKDIAYLVKVDATVETELAQKYNVKGFPTLKVFINKKGKITTKEYNGGRTKADIIDWMKSNVELPLPKVDVVQVSNQKQFNESCIGKVFCVIAFLPPMEDEDTTEKGRLDMIKQLNDASAAATGNNWGWVWIEGTSQDKLEHALNVDQLSYPIVVGVHPGKQVYGVLKSAFNQKNIENFVNKIKVGKEHISSFKVLPTLDETKPWVAASSNKKAKDEL